MAQFEEKLLLSRFGDLEQGVERGFKPCFSRFLDPKEIALFQNNIRPRHPFMLWGGYPASERKMLGFFPDAYDPEAEEFPISALRLVAKEVPGHREILGSLMSLGIERNLLGDIAMEERGAVLFASESICDFLCLNLTQIGRQKVSLERAELSELSILEKKVQIISGTVASTRLDCVLGLLTGVSRTGAEEMLKKELVSVNFTVCKKGAMQLKSGDVLSIRKFGRAELSAVLGETKKGRMRVELKKYI